MTIPYTPPQSPALLANQSDPFAAFAQIMQGISQRKQRAQELELEKQKLAEAQKQHQQETEQNAAVGAGIKNLLMQQESQSVAIPQGLQDILGMPQQMTGLTPLGMTVANMPASAVPKFAAATVEERKISKSNRAIEQSLTQISDPAVRNDFRAWSHLEQTGIKVAPEMLPAVFPALAKKMEGVDPKIADVALRYLMTGEMSFGQVRSLMGIKPIAGVSDDFKLHPTTKNKQSETQMKMGMLLGQMDAAEATLTDLAAKGVTVSVPGQMMRELRMRSRGSGPFSILNAVAGTAFNLMLPEDQKKLIGAQLAGGTAFRFAVSGQQSSDAEAISFMSFLMDQVGDGPETRAQKTAFRHMVAESVRSIVNGTSRSAAVDSLIARGQTLGIPEDVLGELKLQRKYAGNEDKQSTGVTYSRQPADPGAPATVEQIQAIVDDAESSRRIYGTPPPP